MNNIQVQDHQGVRIICFNRPEKRNALNLDMYKRVTEYLIEGEADNGIRAFMFYGNNQCFTSGNDISDFLANGNLGPTHPTVRFLYCLLELKKPIVAAVSGCAVGIGTTLLLHCDLVYADDTASFQLPFVNLALVPEAGASLLLPELIGYQKAAELLLLGDSFSAQTAKQLNMINGIVANEELYQFALSRAIRLAAQPPEALQATRQLMRPHKSRVQHQMHQELEQFGERLQSKEARALFASFLNKKK
ncbi:enoyl-CoA hydratase-related protein [Shewanella sp. NIFS-20-20]|uniref:enoyl-CoA hydratase-related protein n=1 Tax=Shewanella sp. NIFS-20-20 TaxID=2853806 RepID=UPI001C4706F2|nr:enoyl-CoA hydratase-related protein [Shewanella sp. NIFS-20-20]MBV7317057.1 enoyl-CoA hydratase/isomerase family protein [Shewanella sp. NIFS-20-20]